MLRAHVGQARKLWTPGERSEVRAEDFNSAAGCSASLKTGIGGNQRDVQGFG
jgi:hypothetical protein